MRKEKTIIKLFDLRKQKLYQIDMSNLDNLNNSLPTFASIGKRNDCFALKFKNKEKYNQSLSIPYKNNIGHKIIFAYNRGFLEMIEIGYGMLIDS